MREISAIYWQQFETSAFLSQTRTIENAYFTSKFEKFSKITEKL